MMVLENRWLAQWVGRDGTHASVTHIQGLALSGRIALQRTSFLQKHCINGVVVTWVVAIGRDSVNRPAGGSIPS